MSFAAGQQAAARLDGADGVLDGSFFGSPVVAGAGYATTAPYTSFPSTVPFGATSYGSYGFPATSFQSATSFPSAFPTTYGWPQGALPSWPAAGATYTAATPAALPYSAPTVQHVTLPVSAGIPVLPKATAAVSEPKTVVATPVHTPAPATLAPASSNVKVLVLFYSTYGHIFHMANAIAEGARETGVSVTVKRVPETLSHEVLEKMGAVDAQRQFAAVPVADPKELGDYDCIIFGTPTRYGAMAAQMKAFLDATGSLWLSGGLVGKVGGVFVSTASQHGGQETTALSFLTFLLHQGMFIGGLPYAFQGQMGIDEVKGGSPYGATTIAGGKGERLPSATDLDGARFQGRFLANAAIKLAAGKAL